MRVTEVGVDAGDDGVVDVFAAGLHEHVAVGVDVVQPAREQHRGGHVLDDVHDDLIGPLAVDLGVLDPGVPLDARGHCCSVHTPHRRPVLHAREVTQGRHARALGATKLDPLDHEVVGTHGHRDEHGHAGPGRDGDLRQLCEETVRDPRLDRRLDGFDWVGHGDFGERRGAVGEGRVGLGRGSPGGVFVLPRG